MEGLSIFICNEKTIQNLPAADPSGSSGKKQGAGSDEWT